MFKVTYKTPEGWQEYGEVDRRRLKAVLTILIMNRGAIKISFEKVA